MRSTPFPDFLRRVGLVRGELGPSLDGGFEELDDDFLSFSSRSATLASSLAMVALSSSMSWSRGSALTAHPMPHRALDGKTRVTPHVKSIPPWNTQTHPAVPPASPVQGRERIHDFIKDAIEHNYGITNEMHLAIVFAGFEVWAGGDGAKVEHFCVDVK